MDPRRQRRAFPSSLAGLAGLAALALPAATGCARAPSCDAVLEAAAGAPCHGPAASGPGAGAGDHGAGTSDTGATFEERLALARARLARLGPDGSACLRRLAARGDGDAALTSHLLAESFEREPALAAAWVEDADTRVRVAAVAALTLLHRTDPRPLVHRALGDPAPEVRAQ